MFHLLTNYGSLANTANTQVNALADDVVTIANSLHTPAEEYDQFARLALGAQLSRARDVTPSVAMLLNSYMAPIRAGAAPQENQLVEEFDAFPIKRKVSEPITYQITNAVAGPTDTYVFSWLRKTRVEAPKAQPFRMRGTSTTASVASTWTTVVTSWEPQLQSGVYAVVGGLYYATTAIAFSVIFQNQFLRPGALGHATEGIIPWKRQVGGGLGLWGYFPINAMPIMRVLNGGAIAAHTFYLDLVRVG